MYIQTYSEPCVTLAYSEPCYIQNPGIFRTMTYLEPEAYSELCQTSTMERFAKIIDGYNCFRNISLSLSLLYEIYAFLQGRPCDTGPKWVNIFMSSASDVA